DNAVDELLEVLWRAPGCDVERDHVFKRKLEVRGRQLPRLSQGFGSGKRVDMGQCHQDGRLPPMRALAVELAHACERVDIDGVVTLARIQRPKDQVELAGLDAEVALILGACAERRAVDDQTAPEPGQLQVVRLELARRGKGVDEARLLL